jgi:uncharacterized protein
MFRIVSFVLTLLIMACGGKSAYVNKIEHEQKRRNAVFINPEQSPLDTAEIRLFKGLHFFAPDEQYRVSATITWLPQIGYVQLPQSDGNTMPYMQIAVIDFSLLGKNYQLSCYQNEQMKQQHILFIPFSDVTNGKQTYAGGRYIDLPYVDRKNEVELDFNLAYVPFFAHSPRYSCPKVPAHNHLPLEIFAGEK